MFQQWNFIAVEFSHYSKSLKSYLKIKVFTDFAFCLTGHRRWSLKMCSTSCSGLQPTIYTSLKKLWHILWMGFTVFNVQQARTAARPD